MQSTVEPVEGNKVKLNVEVPAETFESEIDAAFKRLAQEVRLPGFRPGKVPRKVLEARLGTGAARDEALNHALPEYYVAAINEHEVDVIASPEIEVTSGRDEGDVHFEAIVEVRPQISVAGYDGLRVTIDSPMVNDEDIEKRLDLMRQQHSTLSDVGRAIQNDDVILIDMQGYRDDEELDDLAATDYRYRVGAGSIVAELDEALIGEESGATLTFTADHPGDGMPAEFEVEVKSVSETVLPELDDEFAKLASEFETIEELRADLVTRTAKVKSAKAAQDLRSKVSEALAELVAIEAPAPMVDNQMNQGIQELAMRLQAQGLDLAQFLQFSGTDPDAFRDQMRSEAEKSVKVDLALRAIATGESIEPGSDDIDEELSSMANAYNMPLEQVREALERNSELSLVRSELRNRKAMDWLLERVEVVDQDGNILDSEAILNPVDDSEESATASEASGSEDGESVPDDSNETAITDSQDD